MIERKTIAITLRRHLVLIVAGLSLFLGVTSASAADIDVLVIGCSKSFSQDHYSGISRAQDLFNPQLVVDELTQILDGDSAFGTVNVVFEDTYHTITRSLTNPVGNYDMKSYSLMHHYYWPDGRTNRLDNLKGAAGTAWDYVVILGDPSFVASTPGVYAKGVKLIVDKIREGTAEPILMMQWPDAGSSVPVSDFGEVTYRVGDSGGIPVAPAGYSWDDLTPKDSGTHPTPDGAYLAAATLYSKIFDRNATTSTYTYDDTLADLAHNTVQTHISQSHYTGLFNTENPYLAANDKDRVIKGDKGDGTSTEDGFLKWTPYADQRHLYNLLAPQISVNNYDDDPGGFSGLTHFHIGRNAPTAGGARYRAWPLTYRNAITFSYQVRNQDSQDSDGGLDHLYGIDYMTDSNRGDQRAAFDLISRGHVAKGVRVLPVKAIWAEAKDELGISTPFYTDGNHYGTDVNEAAVSYMITLLTGRCPIGKNGTATERERRRIGYETSWIMSTLNLRPPGYTVHPSDPDTKTIAPGTNELMSVYFVNAPQTSVTVDVSLDSSTAAIVNPKVLTFDAANHDTVQNIRVTGLPGAAASDVFNVSLQATSPDMCFSNLVDSWEYTTTRSVTEILTLTNQVDRQENAPKNGSKTIDLQVTGSAASNTIFAAPFHGSLAWSGSDVVYTPDTDYVGGDSFAFAVNTGGDLTKGYIEITVEDVPVVNLTVTTAHGTAVPSGVTTPASNSVINALIIDSPVQNGSTQYVCTGWIGTGSATTGSGTNTSFTITTDTTINWLWDTNVVTVYTVVFNEGANGARTGDGALTQSVVEAASAAVPTITPDTGYTFDGWDTTAYTNVMSNMTINAQYTLIDYTLTYLAGANGSISGTQTQMVSHGNSGSAVNAVADGGYHFVDWSDSSTTNPRTDTGVTNDLTVTASFATNAPAMVDNGVGATSLNETSAQLSGELTNGITATAWVCWGVSDAGTISTGDWDNVVLIGAVSRGVPFSTNATGLSTNTTYFYRCYATNAYGADWSDAVTPFSGTPSGSTGAGWTPAEITTHVWYDGSDLSTITQDVSGAVSQWNDKSGSGRHISQGNPSDMPTSDLRTINSMNVIDFDGLTDGMYRNDGNPDGDVTVFTVIELDAIKSGRIWSNQGSGGSKSRQYLRDDYIDFGNNTTAYAAPTGQPMLLMGRVADTGDGSAQGFRLNGGTEVTGTTDRGVPDGMISISMYGDTVQNALDGAIAEIIFLNEIPSEESRQEIEGYLAHKWGLEGSLPTNHTYKSSPPGGGSAIANLGPTGITASNATLNATLGAGGTAYDVYVFYGSSDGGTNAGSWATNSYVGSYTNVSTNASYIASLTAGQTNYYTFMASNATETVWASPSWQFSSLPEVGSPSVTTNHSVPHAWLAGINPAWTNDYEAAATNDYDNDGFSTWEEYWSGTNPTNGNSFLKIDTVLYDGSNVIIEWQHDSVDAAIPPIGIEVSADLTGTWVNVDHQMPSNGLNSWLEANFQKRFYRLAVTNTP